MNNSLRNGIISLGEKALNICNEFFDGKREGTDKVKEASKMISNAIKVEHMNQILDQSNKSLALRLLKHLPDNEKLRRNTS